MLYGKGPLTFTDKTRYNSGNLKPGNNQYNRQNTSGYFQRRDNNYNGDNNYKPKNNGNNFYRNNYNGNVNRNNYKGNGNNNDNRSIFNENRNKSDNGDNKNKDNGSNDRVNLNQVRTLTPTVVMGPTL